MDLNQVKDPKTGSTVKLDENSQFQLSEETVDLETAKERVENGDLEQVEEEVEFNLDENVKTALESMSDLSEEAQTQVKDIIESAVADRVQKKEKELQEQFDTKLQEKEEELIEDVDNYLTYAAEEWKRENQIALEQGARAEISENLLKDLKSVFEKHNIDLPEEKVDQVEELKKEINSLKEKVNNKHEENKSLKEQLETSTREDIISELGENLAQTQFDRFKQLTEDLEFVSEERFKQKAQTVLETYFAKNNDKEEIEEEETPKDVHGNPLAQQALKYL